MASTLPTFTPKPPEVYDVEADAALVQRGLYKKPGFFGDNSLSQNHQNFINGVQTALSYAGQISRKFDLVPKRDQNTGFRLTQAEYELLQKRARSISNYSKIPYDTVEDFLIIICFIDKLPDMKIVADAVQIDELYDQNILQKPEIILNIPGLEKICFAAQALDGLINMFRKYVQASQSTANQSKGGDDIGSVLGAISNLIGGFGGASLGPRLETSDMGNFLSELISGKRIPTNVIAKNPMLQSPSYTGKAFFGEHANPLANVDVDQLFNKAIAVFPQFSSGAGTSSFVMQNFSSFQQEMPIQNFVSKFVTGSADIGSQRKLNQINGIVDKISSLAGAKPTDIIDVRRADNAIPMMMSISTTLSGFDKSVLSASTFQEGWINAQSVANQLMSIDPSFMEAARRFL